MSGPAKNAQDYEAVVLHNENDRFKARYAIYMRWALGTSFIIYLIIFLFTPVFDITPYSLPDEQVEVIDIPETLDIPPPPQELPKPQVPIEAAPDAEVEEEVEIADTLPDNFDDFIPPPSGDGGAGRDFVAFDTKPEIKRWVPPRYPEVAREMQLEGLVIIDVFVGTDGRVMEARVSRPQHNLLNQAALEAARKCTFTPGKQRNIPVPVWVSLPYDFSLF